MAGSNKISITSIEINDFRIIENAHIKPGQLINVITGKNGTGKSTILGMIAQGFSFNNQVIDIEEFECVKNLSKDEISKLKAKPNKTQLEKEKIQMYNSLLTLFGQNFESKSNEHFKMSDLDKRGVKHCKIELSNGVAFDIESTNHDRKLPRLVTRRENSISSNYVFPVIYLGLGRVSPLIQSNKNNDIELDLSQEEKVMIHNLYESILLKRYDNNLKSINTDLKNKNTAAFIEEDKTIQMISSGEDNIGQILFALFSFRKLKNALGDNYKGGILIIDEIDATLYAAAQNKLLDVLINKAREFKIQIFFTTHSLSLLEYIYSLKLESKYRPNSIKIISTFLNDSKKLEVKVDPQLKDLMNEFLIINKEKLLIDKINLYVEDAEAEYIFKKLIRGEKYNNKPISSLVNFQKVKLSCTNYQTLYKANINEFKYNSIVCLDSDIPFDISKMKNFVSLPGKKENPEEFVFNILKDENSEFWKENKDYTYQMFMHNSYYNVIQSIRNGSYNEEHKNVSGGPHYNKPPRVVWKEWFRIEKDNWKKSDPILYWAKNNVEEKQIFITKLKEVLKYTMKNNKIIIEE
ncbi:AAA family ATPase [Macrococcus hajekii]|uniref:AAA family ATPase n=1 Tax=Macrococcus hajekii TaxID=198482 RepID=A0A4R6BJC4_9STAP|nr:ATP-binding protein [Macrococcus hajekii]TDM01799.1 AAA family ATPase [Macrococcus hajekii]GGB07579.1 hypothetical protein GCM10007190_14450 [Macrococcus hajekii]